VTTFRSLGGTFIRQSFRAVLRRTTTTARPERDRDRPAVCRTPTNTYWKALRQAAGPYLIFTGTYRRDVMAISAQPLSATAVPADTSTSDGPDASASRAYPATSNGSRNYMKTVHVRAHARYVRPPRKRISSRRSLRRLR